MIPASPCTVSVITQEVSSVIAFIDLGNYIQNVELRAEGTKGISPVFTSHDAQCALRRAMIRVVESNYFCPASKTLGKFHGAFCCFGTGVGKIN